MTIADLPLPITDAIGKQYAIVFNDAIAARLGELHAQYGRPDCLVGPRRLTDGRLMVCADLLTAIEPGGWLHEMWEHADQEVLLGLEVIPWADAVAMLPQPSEP